MPGILDQFIMHTVLDHLSRKTDAKTPMPVVVVHDARTASGPVPKPPAVVGAVRRALSGRSVEIERSCNLKRRILHHLGVTATLEPCAVVGDEGRFGYSDTLNEAPSKTLSAMPARLAGRAAAVRGELLSGLMEMS